MNLSDNALNWDILVMDLEANVHYLNPTGMRNVGLRKYAGAHLSDWCDEATVVEARREMIRVNSTGKTVTDIRDTGQWGMRYVEVTPLSNGLVMYFSLSLADIIAAAPAELLANLRA